ncbi:MAG: methylmalonyl-CoA mutase family protein [Luteolibacter sp.]
MSDPAQSLLSEFPEHTYEQWHAAAETLLKGASFEKLLVSKTYEDITIQPIYRREDIAGLEHRKHFPGAASLVRGSHSQGFLKIGWEVSQELKACKPQKLNSLIHEGLSGGQSELNITNCASVGNLADMTTALDGVEVDAISTYWRSGADSLAVAAIFFAAAQKSGLDVKALRAAFDNDPFADLVAKGISSVDLKSRFDHIAALTGYVAENAPHVRTITVQGDVYHNAGATATQELGYIVATLVCYIEEMKARGLSPASVFPHIRIRLAIGSDYFMEISKIRAARWLWSKVAEAYGVENAPVHIHASTSKWNKTTYDAHTNMLRVTAEAFAAVIGGVDSLHIGPFDEISGHTDDFSRRVARNVHTILREECGLDRVIDPAGGSTYIEWLTDQIAAKSWGIFQEIEKNGGMLASLESGTIQQAVDAIRNAKFQNIRRRKDKIVGSNMYPNLKGTKLDAKCGNCCHSNNTLPSVQLAPIASVEQAIAAALDGATVSQITAAALANHADTLAITPLPAHRAAEEYEALRDASAAFAVKVGAAPSILQLNIGPSGRYRLRADWTASFFEAAGFAVDGARDFPNAEEAVKALSTSKATIAVITSDDATYQTTVEALAKAVKAAKPDTILLVAGAPGENEAAWRAAGVDDFVNIRSNNYELNQQLLKGAGVL